MGFGMVGGMFVFWIAMVALVVMASRGLFQSEKKPKNGQPPFSAKDVLQLRYARGEITREQFQLMLKDL